MLQKCDLKALISHSSWANVPREKASFGLFSNFSCQAAWNWLESIDCFSFTHHRQLEQYPSLQAQMTSSRLFSTTLKALPEIHKWYFVPLLLDSQGGYLSKWLHFCLQNWKLSFNKKKKGTYVAGHCNPVDFHVNDVMFSSLSVMVIH